MKRIVLSAIILGCGLSAIISFAAEKQNGNERGAWSVKTPLPRTNSEFGVAELDGKIYVMGGYPADRKTVAEVQVYDSKTDKWQIIAPLPQALNHIMPAAVNGKIYVIGGQTTESSEPDKAGFVNTVYEYDPATGKWTARAPMPTMRGGGVAAVVDGRIYVAGGRPPRGHDFAVYDPKADKWTTLANLPTQRNHLAAGAHDGKVYVFGGRFEGGFRSKTTDAVEVFDPEDEFMVGEKIDAQTARRRQRHLCQRLLPSVWRRG